MDAITTTFEDVEKLILYMVHRHWRHHNRKDNFEELVHEANYWFMLAYHKHDVKRSSFVTTVAYYVSKGLQRLKQRRAIEAARSPILVTTDELDRIGVQPAPFSLDEFAEGLSKDALIVLGLVFEPPVDVIVDIAIRGGDTPTRHRSAIRLFLKYLGWSRNRIAAAFTEIQQALDR